VAFDPSPETLAFAEDAVAYLPVGPGRERIEDERYVLWLSPSSAPAATVVLRLRLSSENVEVTVAEVRALLSERGRPAATWEIGASSTPADLEERLVALGMRPFGDPDVVGLILDGDPLPEPGVPVRRAISDEDYVVAERIKRTAFDDPLIDSEIELSAARLRESDIDAQLGATFVAFIGDTPVGQARVIFAERGAHFTSGSVLAEWRGRGAYRALVAARVSEARRRGAPAVISQAGRMSRPILERAGFRVVTTLRVLLDDPR
jgi:predicted N-acetyltransferase YhbS